MFGLLSRLVALAKELLLLLETIEERMIIFKNNMEKLIMATKQEWDDLLAQMGTDIDGIVAKLKNGGLSAEEEQAEFDKLTAFAATLKSANNPPPTP